MQSGPGYSGRSALSPSSSNRVKKEERLEIRRFSDFVSNSDLPSRAAGPQAGDIEEDDIHLLMQSICSPHEERKPVIKQEDRHNGHDPGLDHYPSDEEMVDNQVPARQDVGSFLSLPENEIPLAERMGAPVAMNCRLMPHQMCGLTWMVRQEEDDEKKGGLLAGELPFASAPIYTLALANLTNR